MPVVHINLYDGKSVEVKKKIAVAVTEAFVKSMGVAPELVKIMIHEIPKENFATGGILDSERKP